MKSINGEMWHVEIDESEEYAWNAASSRLHLTTPDDLRANGNTCVPVLIVEKK